MRWTWFEDVTGQWLDKSIGALLERPEAQASVERGQRLIAIAEQARKIARSDIDDTAACDRLTESLPDDRELARGVVELLAVGRTSYVDDRVYRLLCASLDGCHVRRIGPGVREQFLDTDLAEEVVSEHRAAIGEGQGADDQPSTPFLDREHTPVEGFPRFLFVEDPRPRANN